MKLSKKQLTRAFIYEPIPTKQKDGYSKIEYPFSFVVDVVVKNDASKLVSQSYGERIEKMKVCYFIGDFLKEGVHEGWGFDFVEEVSKPEYKIVQISHYQSHTRILIERV